MRYQELNIREKEDFKRVCNYLLSHSLLTRHKENNKKDYYFVENNILAINEYFEILGFEVELNRNLKSVQLINKFGRNKLQFVLFESITLLILRILYQEKMQDLSLSEHVVIEVEELQNKFIALGFKDRLMDKTSLKGTLGKFKRFNIIETLDRDVTLGDSRVIIYPTIQMLVRSENIDIIYEKLKSYKSKGGDDDYEEDDRD